MNDLWPFFMFRGEIAFELLIDTLYKTLCPDNPTVRKVPGSIPEPRHRPEINPLHSLFPVLPLGMADLTKTSI